MNFNLDFLKLWVNDTTFTTGQQEQQRHQSWKQTKYLEIGWSSLSHHDVCWEEVAWSGRSAVQELRLGSCRQELSVVVVVNRQAVSWSESLVTGEIALVSKETELAEVFR